MAGRSPRLFTAALIALVVVCLNFQSNRVEEGGTLKQAIFNSLDQAALLVPGASAANKQVMANTGPGVAQANIQPAAGGIYSWPTATPRRAAYSPAFLRFLDEVADGRKGVVRGVFVPGVLALRVMQQPEGDWSYVSEELGTITEFQSAARHGVIGLLAHNYLSGDLFYKLEAGKEVRIVYGDKSVDFYILEGIYRFQKLTPGSTQSEMIDLQTGETVTTEQVFNRFYRGKRHVTFQTCLEADGLSNWGLTFSVAVPWDGGGE